MLSSETHVVEMGFHSSTSMRKQPTKVVFAHTNAAADTNAAKMRIEKKVCIQETILYPLGRCEHTACKHRCYAITQRHTRKCENSFLDNAPHARCRAQEPCRLQSPEARTLIDPDLDARSREQKRRSPVLAMTHHRACVQSLLETETRHSQKRACSKE